jgi:hypothetical protein
MESNGVLSAVMNENHHGRPVQNVKRQPNDASSVYKKQRFLNSLHFLNGPMVLMDCNWETRSAEAEL